MANVVDTIAEGYRAVHQLLREHIAGADDGALSWAPAPETNSISVLVIHTLGSEAEVWRLVAATPGSRDRAAEFVAGTAGKADLLARLDAADLLLGELAAKIGPEAWETMRERPDRSPHTGLHWLVTNYGHAREHLAHVELTLQLYRARGT
ncbi:MAG: DinB family protein [Chloroflexota bacterium]